MSSRHGNFDCQHYMDAAPFVLGALAQPDEYREHLATCGACQAEVAELQLVVDMLATNVPLTTAPESLRRRVLATVRSEAELLRAAGNDADEPSAPPRRWRPPRGMLVTGWVAVAATAAAAALVALNVGSSASERVIAAQIGASAPGAHASLHQRDGRAELVVADMPAPGRGKIYEVWLKHGAALPQPTDALFGVTSRGSGTVAVPDSLRGVSEVLVTSEPLGGSHLPTAKPVIRVVVSA